MIDLRSDTVTRPTERMRAAMARAPVGDDVFGEDPTVNALEAEVARIAGKSRALFVPSGTMANQLAIATQTRPGDDVIVGEGAHPVHFEGGAAAALSGVQFSVAGAGGLFSADEMESVVQAPYYWCPRTALVMIENTHNRAGGRVWPLEQLHAVVERARRLGMATHLDGARLWNASAASGVDIADICAPFDTVSLCFSKGLGAPVGSAFCGAEDKVTLARRLRKRWGGAMRQAGILAAGALYALEQHRGRIADDHAHAMALATQSARVDALTVDVGSVETNIVNIAVTGSAPAVAERARELGLLVGVTGPHRLRAVTHLDVSRADVDAAATILAQAVAARDRG